MDVLQWIFDLKSNLRLWKAFRCFLWYNLKQGFVIIGVSYRSNDISRISQLLMPEYLTVDTCENLLIHVLEELIVKLSLFFERVVTRIQILPHKVFNYIPCSFI